MTDHNPATPVRQLLLAFVLLSRWTVPRLPDTAFAQASGAVWAYPVVGLVLGAVAVAAGSAALVVGVPAGVAAGVTLALLALQSGSMHEDGLADTADGLWGGRDRQGRLAIMKDSQIGTYGVLALLFVTGLRWLACAALLPVAPLVVIASAALSRAAMPAVMAALPHARATGLSQSVGRPTPAQAGLSVACGVIVAILLSGGWAFAMASIALIAAVCSGLIAQRKIGGQTGDILGATQQLADCGILIAMGAVLA